MATNYDLQQTGDEIQERINTVPENASSIESLTELYNALQDSKADVATTLAGYGITDAYTKAAVDNLIAALSSQNIVVGALPETGEANTIYRVPGNGSYTDYMWFDSAWKELATYSMEFDQTQVGYFICDTSASTAAKVVAAPGYTLAVGGNMRIKMTNANTVDAVTLNINGAGAKALYYNGAQANSSNSWEAGEVLTVYYDGTQYQASNAEGGGRFATGEKIKDMSVRDFLTNDQSLVTGEGIANAMSFKRLVQEIGFYVVDAYNNIAMKYDSNGFDVASLSSHFISLVKSLIGNIDGLFKTNEDGFYITDSDGYVVLQVCSNGFSCAMNADEVVVGNI